MKILTLSGVKKLRVTGGEPFVRKDLIGFLDAVGTNCDFEQLHLTTNGVLTLPYIEKLEQIGFDGINLSLDTLDKQQFFEITRRDEFNTVFDSLEKLLETSMKIKINAVIMKGVNEDAIQPLVDFTKHNNIEVRFIEEMPFNGSGTPKSEIISARELESILSKSYSIKKLDSEANGTATRYQVEGYQGKVGIIPAFTRSFCGTCNRLRIDPKGNIQTCLYGQKEGNLLQLLRTGAPDQAIIDDIASSLSRRKENGFEAEKHASSVGNHYASMATIGG